MSATKSSSTRGRHERAARLHRARRIRALAVQIPFLIVMCVIAVAAIYLVIDRWRRGAVVFGAAALLAAIFRAALPSSRVGLLQVRGRVVDVITLSVAGVLILSLAASIDALGTN